MKYSYIRAIDYYIPEGRFPNSEALSKLKNANNVRFNEEDIDTLLYGCKRKFEFLGIESRSFSIDQKKDSYIEMAAKAARKALERANISTREVDCVILSGITNPYREPAGACILSHCVGIEHSDFFDINDTCNGFMKSMELASLYLEAGKYKNILIVASENPLELEKGLGGTIELSSMEECDNRLSNLLVGAGAAAMVLGTETPGAKIAGYANKRETFNWDSSLLRIPYTGMPVTKYGREIDGFWSDARLISSETIRELPLFITETLAGWDVALSSVDVYILHQLGNNITYAILNTLGVPKEKAPVNTFSEFGNMGSANIPVNLAIADQKGFIGKGDKVLLISSACGLSYAIAYLIW